MLSSNRVVGVDGVDREDGVHAGLAVRVVAPERVQGQHNRHKVGVEHKSLPVQGLPAAVATRSFLVESVKDRKLEILWNFEFFYLLEQRV